MNSKTKNIFPLAAVLLSVGLLLSACGDNSNHGRSHNDDAEAEHGHGHGEGGTALTLFNNNTELFVEFEPFVSGQSSNILIHLTRIDRKSFTPIMEGSVTVTLSGGGKSAETFIKQKPSRTGIFSLDVKPKHDGKRLLKMRLESGKLVSVHSLGQVTVYPNRDQLPHVPEEEEEANISFLKEQQWRADFAHRPVGTRLMRESVTATGIIRPRFAGHSGEAQISAPTTGRVRATAKGFPEIGGKVKANQVLAIVGGRAVRSPIAGTVSQIYVTNGASVLAGQPLFNVIDLTRLWIEASVPEADIGKLTKPTGLWIKPEGIDRTIVIDTSLKSARLVSFGGSVDPITRTLSVVFEFDNPRNQLRTGQYVQAHVFTGRQRRSLAIPLSAIVEEGFQQVVFVTVDGETFERRPVRLGIRDGNHVEVIDGLKAGERVVTRGAYLVYLAAAAPATTGHGHAH